MKTIAAASATKFATAADPLAPLIETALCLAAIAALVVEDDIPVEELELRIHPYSECAAAVYCPKVAFDPVAIRLPVLAVRQRGTHAGAEWPGASRVFTYHSPLSLRIG